MSDETLRALLLSDPKKRDALLRDCERLVDSEVAAKGGITGMAIKAGYKFVCGIKQGFVRSALERLVDPFVDSLETLYQRAKEAGTGNPADFVTFIKRNTGSTADALLSVTDERVDSADNPVLRSTYQRLRSSAKKHVEEALPRAADMLGRHL